MDLETFVQGVVDTVLSHMTKPQIQKVISQNVRAYTLYTKSVESAENPALLDNVKIITPYAGNGFGMVCSPRSSDNIVSIPLRMKNNAVVAVGRYFTEDDVVPEHFPGDFLIEHETHSKFLFRVSQPAVSSEGLHNGDLLNLKTIAATKSTRVFEVSLNNKDKELGVPPLREQDIVQVYYGIIQKAGGSQEQAPTISNIGPGDCLYAWKSNITIQQDKAIISINADAMSFPGIITDYTDQKNYPDTNFRIVRLPPIKGFLMLEHYTGSTLQYEEDPDFKTIYPKVGQPFSDNQAKLVRYNRNAVIGDKKTTQTKDGYFLPATYHQPKGSLKLHHYSRSGLKIAETEPQLRGRRLKLDLSLNSMRPNTTEILGETAMTPLPSTQILMEEITQSDVDIATRMAFRHLTSAVMDESTCETNYTPEPIPQKEIGHFGIDHVNKQEIALEGSGIFISDYLRRYNDETKGWQFVSLSEAEEYYQELQNKYYDMPEGYKIEEKERIVPASGRRDVLLREQDIENVQKANEDGLEGDIHDVRLVNYEKNVDAQGNIKENDKKTRNDENKEFIGQKGYTFKTQFEKSPIKESTFEDGYLCFPKGDLGLRHYTRSGIEIRELEPNLDYHAVQAAFSLFAWDNGQYYQPHHKNDEQRNFRKMKFGPYPLPLAQLLLENAKYQIPETEPTVTTETTNATVVSQDTQALKDHIKSIIQQQNTYLNAVKIDTSSPQDISYNTLANLLRNQFQAYQQSKDTATPPNEYQTDSSTYKTDTILSEIYANNPLLGAFWTDFLLGQREVLSIQGQKIFDNIYGNISYAPSNTLIEKLHKEVKYKWANKDNDIKRAAKHIYFRHHHNINISLDSTQYKNALSEAFALADIRQIVTAQQLIIKNFLEFLPVENVFATSMLKNFSSFKTAQSVSQNHDLPFPTKILPHTIHPQPDIWETDADKDRTTLALPGETATSLSLYQYSSHIQTVGKQVDLNKDRVGSRLLIRDYVMRAKPDEESSYLIAASKWENVRGEKHNLIAPKGAVELHHYTNSGLVIADKKPHFLNKCGGGHAMQMRLEMHSFDFLRGAQDNDDIAIEQGVSSEQAGNVIRAAGGDVLAKNMEGGLTKAVKPAPLFEKPDGTFFCEILSNELVDKGEEYALEIDKEGRLVKEEDSVRGKYPEEPHGKRGAKTGLTHDTTRTDEHDIPCSLLFEDYIVEIAQEGDELNSVLQPTHLYDEAKKGETRRLIMPRGYGQFSLFNNSALIFGDAITDINTAPEKLDELERGKWQKPYTKVSMTAWNNMKIEDAKKTPAKPFDKASAELIMECIADQANTEGKDATKVLLIQRSSQQNDNAFGSALLFEDFIQTEDEHSLPYHGYKKSTGNEVERLELTFPKGKTWLHSYNQSGLFIDENCPETLDEQQISVCLAMREWDNAEPEEKGAPFSQDTAHLRMIELCPKATKEGKRAVFVNLETFTSSTNEQNPGTALFVKDFVDSDMPAHIYDNEGQDTEGLKKVLFPKGELGLRHYTRSGLHILDQEQKCEPSKHAMLVSLAMREWDNSGDGKAGKPFDEDSASLLMRELLPEITTQGKRASQIRLEAFTSRADGASYGSHLNIEDFVDGDEASHIFQGGGTGLQKPSFPKGKLEILHYTESGLIIEDQQRTNDASLHQASVQVRLRQWGDNAPEGEDLAQIYAWDEYSNKNELGVHVGFLHNKTESRCYIKDLNKEKDKHKIECGMNHWTTSWLKFEDLTEQDNKQVDIKLYHMKDSYLYFHQKNENPGDMLIDLHHTKDTGYKVDNNNNDTTLTIYHIKGSTIIIDKDGNINIDAVKNVNVTAAKDIIAQAGGVVTVTAAQSATIKAPKITLDGDVTVTGELDCKQNVNVVSKVTAAEYNNTLGNLV